MADKKANWKDPQQCMLRAMLARQEYVNTMTRPSWKNSEPIWHRMIYLHCADLIRLTGTPSGLETLQENRAEARMQMLNIWQAGLSLWRFSYGRHDTWDMLVPIVAREVTTAQLKVANGAPTGFLKNADKLIEYAGRGTFNCEAFFQMGRAVGTPSLEVLYREFMARSILEDFRQSQGEQTGAYSRNFGGWDDEQAVRTLLSVKPLPSADIFHEVSESLLQEYTQFCAVPQ